MNTFYTESELKTLGIHSYGENVLIGRNAILYHPESLTIGHNTRIDDFCIISGNVTLGSYIHISQFCALYGGGGHGIVMEDFSGLSSKVTIYAVSDDYSGMSMTNPMIPEEYKPTIISGKVLIEQHAIVGVASMVLPNVVIAIGGAIGAMSLCTKNTDPWTIYAGIPAKKIKERKQDILNLEQMFQNSLMNN